MLSFGCGINTCVGFFTEDAFFGSVIIFSVSFVITSGAIGRIKISSDTDFGEIHDSGLIKEIWGTGALSFSESFLEGHVFSVEITEVLRCDGGAIVKKIIAVAFIGNFNAIGFEAIFKIFWESTLFFCEKFFSNTDGVFRIWAKHSIGGASD